ncbi:Methionine--tRNA ligase [bioreactor metagenome]|uniref:Methionine--tRNA ligase n=1 Tax=bioreactor metagenome TaxID=1076179 RepID=A0A645IJ77_9ZZZZ
MKYLDKAIPNGTLEVEIGEQIGALYNIVGEKIENGQLKEALDKVFEYVRFANKYYDLNEPWKTRRDDIEKCNQTLFNCVQIVANLSVLLEPFLPFSSKKVFEWLCLNNTWGPQWVAAGYSLPEIEILFTRIVLDDC